MGARIAYFFVHKKALKFDGPRIVVYIHAEQWARRNMRVQGVHRDDRPIIVRDMRPKEIEEYAHYWRLPAVIYDDAVELMRDEYLVAEDDAFCARLEEALKEFRSLKNVHRLPLAPHEREKPSIGTHKTLTLFDREEMQGMADRESFSKKHESILREWKRPKRTSNAKHPITPNYELEL